MAFGFPAYHEDTRKFDIKNRVLAAAVENSLRDLGWQFERDASGAQFDVRIGFSVWSYAGERINIQIDKGGNIWVRSECASPIQCYDGMPFPWYGKNRNNVERFFDALSQSLSS